MPIVAVLGGPTASGKSALALRWARARGLEILSADSRQLYRGFAIGTGAPTADERAAVPHHLVGHTDPSEAFSPQRFRVEARSIVESRPDARFIVVGGTGLYLKEWMFPSVSSGEAPGSVFNMPADIRAAAEREIAERGAAAVHADLSDKDPGGMEGVAPQDLYRIQKRLENWLFTGKSYVRDGGNIALNPLFKGVPFVWLNPARHDLHKNIEARIRSMFADGWIDEVRLLMQAHDPETAPAFNALGYREIADALKENALRAGEDVPPPDLLEKILVRTRQYAKKQTTFFRNQFDPARHPDGFGAHAFSPADLVRRLESSGWDPKSIPGPI
jgi:tRNA dimethylallyltransferase